jgi:signal transduction histidine kinase
MDKIKIITTIKSGSNTLSFRIFLFTSIWMLASLIVVALVVLQDYRQTVEKQFEDLITANLYNLMGSVSRGENGSLQGTPELGDSRYRQYQSGWYWSVSSLGDKNNSLSSSSLGGGQIPRPEKVNFNSDFQRSYRIDDSLGNSVLAVEAQVFLGEGENIYTFRATGNLVVLDEEISNFRQRLILILAVSGLGLVLASIAIVRFSLKPIRSATSQLADIRLGDSNNIVGKFPAEIAPLIEETNALIKSNRAIVERSRTQVGNLAHSLKTPLSVLSLEVENLAKPLKQKMRAQLTAMNLQIQSYLNRAMISARHGTITSRTDVHSTLVRLVRTFNKLFPGISFQYDHPQLNPSDDVGAIVGIFAGEQQDFEEIIGNILENSGKFAVDQVSISTRQKIDEKRGLIEIIIKDNGAGLSDSEISYVLKRGNRLDENSPGTGLGLSIVSDILKEYGGELQIEAIEAGGLRVTVRLPAIPATS